jgi:hypothetical protein
LLPIDDLWCKTGARLLVKTAHHNGGKPLREHFEVGIGVVVVLPDT